MGPGASEFHFGKEEQQVRCSEGVWRAGQEQSCASQAFPACRRDVRLSSPADFGAPFDLDSILGNSLVPVSHPLCTDAAGPAQSARFYLPSHINHPLEQ